MGGLKPKSLRILTENSPLRGDSPFLSQPNWPPQDTEQAPRALRGLARIVGGGLCHRCGTCIGICPTNVLEPDSSGYPCVARLSSCTDCDLCVRVCPGDEFNFHAFHREIFGTGGSLQNTHGHFIQATVGYSNEPEIRRGSTSGGLVTAILLHLLETKQIDGAAVIVSDPNTLWKGRPLLARSREEILSAMKSKYAICPTNEVLSVIREQEGNYALVGLPCQIHGYHKAAALDSRIKSRVKLTVGLFCHAAIEHQAFEVIWETLPEEKRDKARRFISRVGKHPGSPHVELEDGSLYPVYFGNRQGYRPTSIEVINVLYRLYTPERCTTCFDALSEFADISVGDPWLPPPETHIDWYDGWSFSLIRTSRGKNVYDQLVENKKITSVDVTSREALASNRMMANEKRHRAFRVIETHRRQGKPIPCYGNHAGRLPRSRGLHFMKTEIHMLSHIFCFLPNHRAQVLRFFLGSGGYRLFWLNSKRRAFRTWLRDSLYWLKRRVIGRT